MLHLREGYSCEKDNKNLLFFFIFNLYIVLTICNIKKRPKNKTLSFQIYKHGYFVTAISFHRSFIRH